MLPDLQREFAEKRYSEKSHQLLLAKADEAATIKVEWRISEMPIFLSQEYKRKIEQYSIDITKLCLQPPHSTVASQSLEPRHTVPHEDAKPLFIIADYALTGTAETGFDAKLVELQGFPSLYTYQFVFSGIVREHYGYHDLDYTLSGLSDTSYLDILRSAIVGNQSPDDVILMEYKPVLQKTRPDFLATQRLFGVSEVDICTLTKQGNKLYYPKDGQLRQVRRIYNRAIVDELESESAVMPFAWTDELDVEWAGHPNWYFKISKHSLPFLHHPAVPSARFLDELDEIPHNLEDYVLKPLYSFAGKGVNVFPTEADILAVPATERHGYLLQEKIRYSEPIYTPEGMNKAEIRVMLIWLPEQTEPIPMIALARTGRGPMMGVRFNSSPWTGSNACLFG